MKSSAVVLSIHQQTSSQSVLGPSSRPAGYCEPAEASTRGLLFEVLSGISELERVYETLLVRVEAIAEKSERDELSSLLRRNAFFTKWRMLIQKSISDASEAGVLLVDVDHFKQINDTQGHAQGDEVIRRLGGLLREFEAVGLVCGRYGGEEFAVAYQGPLERGQRIAKQIHDQVGSIGITVSQGLCHSERPVLGQESADLSRADEALYEAKRSGRNRTCLAK
jgi:diguanylate cyclase (GGDEF)-like protein